MGTVLGLSMTSTSIGWVLVDGRHADGATIDHDVFDVCVDTDVAAGRTSQQVAAVRGAQAIATASGRDVQSIGLTWSDDAETEASRLLESLTDLGFANVVAVRLAQAAQAWAQGPGRDLGYGKTAVCVIEPAAVTVLAVDNNDGAVHTAVTHTRESASADGLSKWLAREFDRDDRRPERLLLAGSRNDLRAMTSALGEALSIPVFASAEAQLVLARGAALAMADGADSSGVQASQGRRGDKPANGRSRFIAHTRVVTMSAAAGVAVVTALLTAGSQLTETDSRPSEIIPGAATSLIPVIANAVLPTVSAPPAPQPPTSVAEPPQAPGPSAEPLVSPEVPPPQPDVVEDQAVSPPAAVPVAALNEPLTPPPVAAPQEPIAPPPVEPNPAPSPDPVGVVLSPLFGALP